MPTVVEFPIDATSGLELCITHQKDTAGCEAVRFPNQQFLPVYVEQYAYVGWGPHPALGASVLGGWERRLQKRRSHALMPEIPDEARRILDRVGLALIVFGLLDMGVMIYCIVNSVNYSSSFNLFAVLGYSPRLSWSYTYAVQRWPSAWVSCLSLMRNVSSGRSRWQRRRLTHAIANGAHVSLIKEDVCI